MSESERLSQSALLRLNAMIDELQQQSSEVSTFTYQKDFDACMELLQGAELPKLESFGVSGSTDRNLDEKHGVHLVESGRRFTDPRLIGVGAYAMVFGVFDTALKIDVALKILKPSKADSSEYQARFLGEAHSTAQLSHSGIIRIFDTGRIGNIPFLTCEYAAGGSLRDWLMKNPSPMDQYAASHIIADIAEAVHYAHSKLTLHRDIKPGNILLCEQSVSTLSQLYASGSKIQSLMNYRPVLADFGLCKKIGSVPSEWTTEGTIVGTARYMSPEQASGLTEDLRTTTDVYSMGVVLYQLLTGRVPFDAEFESQIRSLVRTKLVTRPSVYRQDLSKDLEAIVLKCLERNSELRYQTARELHTDLKRFIAGDNVSARNPSLVRSFVRLARRHPITTALAGMLLATNFTAIALINKSRNDAVRASNETIRVIGRLHTSFGDEIIERTLISPSDYQEKLAESIAYIEEWMGKYGESESAIHTLSVLRHYSSLCHYMLGQSSEGINDRTKVIESQKKLLSSQPGDRKLRFQMATSLLHLATAVAREYPERNQEVLHSLDTARQEVELLGQLSPSGQELSYRIEAIDLGNAIDRQKAELVMVEDPEAAHQLYNRVIATSTELFAAKPTQPMLLSHAVFALVSQSFVYEQQKDLESCLGGFQAAENLAISQWGEHWEKGWTTGLVSQMYFEWYCTLHRANQYRQALEVLVRWGDFHRLVFPYATGCSLSGILGDKYTIEYSILCLKKHCLQKLEPNKALEDEGLQWGLVTAAGKLEANEEKLQALQQELGRLEAACPELSALLKQAELIEQEVLK